MKVYIEKEEICNVPDHLIVNDTIIFTNKVFIIKSKTWDADEKELYCKVKEIIEESDSISSILTEIYNSDHFQTSGSNTNNIKENPRTIILLVLAGLIIDSEFFEKSHADYMSNIMTFWNDKKINWDKIFNNNPPIQTNDISLIKTAAIAVLSDLKINKNLWPNLES